MPFNAADYHALIEALRRITDQDNVPKVAGEYWLRVLDAVPGVETSTRNSSPTRELVGAAAT